MPPKDKDNDMKITFEGGTFSMGNDNWIPSDSVSTIGTATTSATVDSMDPFGDVSAEMGASYSFGDLNGQMSFDYEGDLRKKYPALKDAWNHYQNVKQMCETREKEEDGS